MRFWMWTFIFVDTAWSPYCPDLGPSGSLHSFFLCSIHRLPSRSNQNIRARCTTLAQEEARTCKGHVSTCNTWEVQPVLEPWEGRQQPGTWRTPGWLAAVPVLPKCCLEHTWGVSSSGKDMEKDALQMLSPFCFSPKGFNSNPQKPCYSEDWCDSYRRQTPRVSDRVLRVLATVFSSPQSLLCDMLHLSYVKALRMHF